MNELSDQTGPILIGMRGSGKSTIGPIVARILGMGHADSDLFVEDRMGKSISEIFREMGEAQFRTVERQVLLDLFKKKGLVISAGGGAVLDPEVRSQMRKRVTVWLRAPMEVLAARIEGSGRPTLTGGPITDELAEVFESRKKMFEASSSSVIDTSACGPEAAAAEIAGLWRSRMNRGGM